jgi:hypothetical protein
MRTILATAFLVSGLIAPALAQPTTQQKICLSATSVEGTTVVDNNHILFRMKDGKVWENTLKQDCPNLKFYRGFSEVVEAGQICANEQEISVLQSRNPCFLGDFTLKSAPRRD